MIGRADIEESKSHVALVAWRPQASYPCGNFSVTSRCITCICKGSIDHAFTSEFTTDELSQISFYSFALRIISEYTELTIGLLR